MEEEKTNNGGNDEIPFKYSVMQWVLTILCIATLVVFFSIVVIF